MLSEVIVGLNDDGHQCGEVIVDAMLCVNNMAAQIEDILVAQHLSDHHQHSRKAAYVVYAVNVHQALNSLLS